MISLYDATIRYTDAEIGRLIDKLEISGQISHTVIVILADHGEEFLEHADFEFAHYRYSRTKKHGTGHGHSLFQELIRVPMIITNLNPKGKFSIFKRERKKIKDFVQLVDLVPTLLEYIGLPPPPNCDGSSLLPLIFRWRLPFYKGNKYKALSHRSILSESTSRGNLRISLIEAPYKFIYSYKEHDVLFNLKEDPLERKNLICEKPELASQMLDKILYIMEDYSPSTVKVSKLKKEYLEALKSLGYIDVGIESPKVKLGGTQELNVDDKRYQPLTKVYGKHGLSQEAARLYRYCTNVCEKSIDQ
jgi:arylsulfatase A-like enzyme